MKTCCLILLLALAASAAGQNCPPQASSHLDGLDPNRITINPETGAPLCVHRRRGLVNTTVTIAGTVCDDDGDLLLVWREDTGAQLPVDPNTGTFTFTVTSAEPGAVYVPVGVTDGTATVMGCYVVEFYVNRAPVLGAVPAAPKVTSAWRQKLLMIWHKATGLPLTSGFALVGVRP